MRHWPWRPPRNSWCGVDWLTLVSRPAVDVLEGEHRPQVLLVVAWKAAPWRETIGLAVRTEQPIPKWQIGKVVAMHTQLMVDGVKLGRLDQVFEPARRSEVRVVEEFGGRGEEIVPEGSLQ